jgi:hypothetical protein
VASHGSFLPLTIRSIGPIPDLVAAAGIPPALKRWRMLAVSSREQHSSSWDASLLPFVRLLQKSRWRPSWPCAGVRSSDYRTRFLAQWLIG